MHTIQLIGSALGPIFLILVGLYQIKAGKTMLRGWAPTYHHDAKCRYWSGIVLVFAGVLLGVGTIAYQLSS